MKMKYLATGSLMLFLPISTSAVHGSGVHWIRPHEVRPYRRSRELKLSIRRQRRVLRREEYHYGSDTARGRWRKARHDSRAIQALRRRLVSRPSSRAYDNSRTYAEGSRSTRLDRNGVIIRQRLHTALERERQWHHLRPLVETPAGDRLARMRAGQLQAYGFTHYDANGRQWYLRDEARLHPRDQGFQDRDSSENIAQAAIGDAIYHNGSQVIGYHARNARSAADEVIDMEMVHDQGEHNGHRANILDPSAKYLGLGVHYDQSQGIYNVAEEFSQEQP